MEWQFWVAQPNFWHTAWKKKKKDCDPCKLFLSLETDTDPGCECQIEHSYERFQWWVFFFSFSCCSLFSSPAKRSPLSFLSSRITPLFPVPRIYLFIYVAVLISNWLNKVQVCNNRVLWISLFLSHGHPWNSNRYRRPFKVIHSLFPVETWVQISMILKRFKSSPVTFTNLGLYTFRWIRGN